MLSISTSVRRRLILPAILIEPCRGIAPRPVVGFCDVPLEPAHQIFERNATLISNRVERFFCVALSYFVRVSIPELIEPTQTKLLFLGFLFSEKRLRVFRRREEKRRRHVFAVGRRRVFIFQELIGQTPHGPLRDLAATRGGCQGGRPGVGGGLAPSGPNPIDLGGRPSVDDFAVFKRQFSTLDQLRKISAEGEDMLIAPASDSGLVKNYRTFVEVDQFADDVVGAILTVAQPFSAIHPGCDIMLIIRHH
jgi:hypothetical protein